MRRSIWQFRPLGAGIIATAALALVPAGAAASQPLPRHSQLRAPVTTGVAGPESATSFSATLPSGRRVTPAGDSVVVGSSPLSALLTPDGRFLVTSNDSERSVSCPSAPCPTFSRTEQNGAGQTPAGYTLTVLRVERGLPAPAVARVAFTGASAFWTRIPLGPTGHRQIALPGFNDSNGSGVAQSPDFNLRSLWLGLAMKPLTPTSAELYAAGGPNNALGAYTLDWTNPASVTFRLDATVGIPSAAIPSSDEDANKGEAAPGGLVLDGNTLWVLNNDAGNVQRFDVSAATTPVAAGAPVSVGLLPYGGALSDGKLFVTNWGVAARRTNATWRASVNPNGVGNGTLGIGGGLTPADSLFANPVVDPTGSSSVSVIDAATGDDIATIGLGRTIDGIDVTGGTHPSAITAGPDHVVYVTDTNEDTIAVIDGRSNELVRKVALPSPAPPGLLGTRLFGLQPDALAFDASRDRLYVAEAGLDSVAVMDTSDPLRPEFVGRIPTGWYPTALQLSADGKTLFVANAKGAGSYLGFPGDNSSGGALFDGQPRSANDVNFQFGTLQRIDLDALDLAASSARVISNTVDWGEPQREQVLRAVSRHIDHVFYILKENKTYDSYFGADTTLNGRGADGWPGYAEWDAVVPNMKRMAEQFAIGDNMYADAEESDAGHQFVLAGQSTDYQQKTLLSRSRRTLVNVKNQDPEDYPLTGYLFNDLARNGVPFRDYGDTVRVTGYDEGRNPDPCQDDPGQQSAPGQPCSAATYDPSDTQSPTIGFGGRYATTVPALSVLAGNVDVNYPGWNVRITDQRRAREFVKDFGQRMADGTVPAFTFIWLPQDHTGGLNLDPCNAACATVKPGFQVQDGDAATGQIVDFLSHSRLWDSSAIFVAADDAQSTADHVYAHRTYAMVVSPWAKRQAVVHILGSTVSITKTAEELLGIPPMSYGDAMATDLADFFTTTPDSTPYDVVGAPTLRYAGAGEARMAAGVRATRGRVRATGAGVKVRHSPRIADRIARQLDRLDGGLDQDTARIGAISSLWLRSARLARHHRVNSPAYRRAQDRLYARAKRIAAAG